MATNYLKFKKAFLIAALVIVVIEVLGAIDLFERSYRGFWTDGNNTVIKVFDDGPAQKAGFKVGDILLKSGGIDVEDTKALYRRPRAEIGEERIYTVKRGEEVVELGLIFSGLSTKLLFLNFANALIGLAFLFFLLIPYMKVQTKLTTLLALIGTCLGFLFINRPGLPPPVLDVLHTQVYWVILFLGVTSLLHLMLSFPRPKRILDKKSVMNMLYAIPALIFLFFLFFNVVQPRSTGFMNTVINFLIGAYLAVYIGSTLVALVHSYVKSSKEERTSLGLNALLTVMIIGLIPYIITMAVGAVAPKVIFPGVEFYFLLFILIPAFLSRAVLKAEVL